MPEGSSNPGMSKGSGNTRQLGVTPSMRISVGDLKNLVLLRNLAIGCQLGAICFAHFGLGMALPMGANLLVLLLLASGNYLTWRALRGSEPILALRLGAQLGFDILGLTALLYLNGGYTNPFAFLYLLPLAIAATLLPTRQVWLLALLTIGAYSFLIFDYRPLPNYQGPLGNFLHLHLAGMWISYVLGAVAIAYFVEGMARSARDREQDLAKSREQALNNERLITIGTQAAGIAHELSTPLSTMAVLAQELKNQCQGQPRALEDLDLLCSQLEHCKKTLADRLSSSGVPKALAARAVALDTFFADLFRQWQAQQRGVRVELTTAGQQPAPVLILDETFRQAIVNLLNNAIEASADQITCLLRWDREEFQLRLLDNGQGMAAETLAQVGVPYISTRAAGRGLGLFLSQSVIDRLGGRFRLSPGERGTEARINIPWPPLSP